MSQPSLMQSVGSGGISKPTTLVSLVIHGALVAVAVIVSAHAVTKSDTSRVKVTFYTPPAPEPEGGSPAAPAVAAAQPERPQQRRRPRPEPQVNPTPVQPTDLVAPSEGEDADDGAPTGPVGPITAPGGTGNGMGNGTGNGVGDGRGTAAPAPIYLPQGAAAPRRLSGEDPQLTPQALRARVQGMMIIRLHVDASGAVREVKVMRGLALMDEHVKRVLGQWRFQPYVHNGQRTPVYLIQRIRFQLEG